MNNKEKEKKQEKEEIFYKNAIKVLKIINLNEKSKKEDGEKR